MACPRRAGVAGLAIPAALSAGAARVARRPDEQEAQARADAMLAMLHSAGGAAVPVLLHGEGSSCWPALRYARSLGLATRVGLEDVLVMPNGSPAPDNATLVIAALQQSSR